MSEVSSDEVEVRGFIGPGAHFYQQAFSQMQDENHRRLPFLPLAALLGSFWLGARRIRGWFWLFLTLELVSVVLIVLALGGGLDRTEQVRVNTLVQLAERRVSEAAAARVQDPDSKITASLTRSAQSLEQAAKQAQQKLTSNGPRFGLLGMGLAILLISRIGLGFGAVPLVASRLRHACINGQLADSGFSWFAALQAVIIWLLVIPLTFLNFAGLIPANLFDAAGVPDLVSRAASVVDGYMLGISSALSPVAQQVSWVIERLLDGLEFALTETPWPVITIVIVALAAQRAGGLLALGVALGLGYLLAFGYWVKAMQTVALLGTASIIALLFGIPVGIWCGYSRRTAAIIRPVLDFMQTTPAFVYLIPVIALFGIGKTAGIVATVIFGIAPVIRQTSFGIASVPPAVREAALAFGAGRGFMLFKVDLPIARSSIMAGVSQTILMSLSMVVIAALIGARGLGEEVLSALQYAAQGKGILAGFAILICAIIIDRIIQSQRSQK
jgi:glycine betaine/proline transport system permease protein